MTRSIATARRLGASRLHFTVRATPVNAAHCRRSIVLALLATPALGFAQAKPEATTVEKFRAGAFEFPMSGVFTVEQEGDATVLTTPDETRRFTLASFTGTEATVGSRSEQIARTEAQIRANWERFATREKGKVVRAFKRSDTATGVAVFSMATEFTVDGDKRAFVQFAATDGSRFGTLFAEAFGDAKALLDELEPLALKVRVVEG